MGGSRHLNNSIQYIMNPKKTEDGKLIGGNAGMTPKEVYQTMMDTKSDWEKLDGRQDYHFLMSASNSNGRRSQVFNRLHIK